jgi:hypothetical protein
VSYFPFAILLKSTLPLLALGGWAAYEGIRRTRGRSFALQFIAIPAVAYLAIAMIGDINIGHRHVLPLYPLAFLAAGSLGRLADGDRRRSIALVALLALHAVSSFWSCPRYLSYFNALAGGSSGGWKHLVDSNIDWGQDLKRLREKMSEHGIESVHLIYFGTADPAAYGVRYRKVLWVRDMRPDLPRETARKGDVVAVSVTLLQMLDLPEIRDVRARWRPFDRAGDSILLYRVP